ncbi:hypothetical protein [Nitratireductor aquibiodomus]|uniref:hypothetical protein n=1 Tax=Nitratireductor aquibiodomus TaxID=204799 RepID=UPI000469CFC6|nr:hypothetical protein [Nitratireductor aquibiodomus]
MARCLLACRGEGQWGSREDDNSKIDMIMSIEHPWCPKERMLILCQAKSGASYGRMEKRGGFKLFKRAKTRARRTNHAVCILWVDRDTNHSFWAYVHPDSTATAQNYGNHHRIGPAMVYDLARSMSHASGNRRGGRGVIIPETMPDLKASRSKAIASYRSHKVVRSPVLGDIEFTKHGWRHMFRKSRSASSKQASLGLIPRLPAILQHQPSTMALLDVRFERECELETRTAEYLLKFRDVRRRSALGVDTTTTAHVRVIEEIRYPQRWYRSAMLSQQIKRRVILKSAYYKDV